VAELRAEVAHLRGQLEKLHTAEAIIGRAGSGLPDSACTRRRSHPGRVTLRPSSDRRPYRRRRARVYLRLGCGPVGCSVPLLAVIQVAAIGLGALVTAVVVSLWSRGAD
jgi:hypothetical protein